MKPDKPDKKKDFTKSDAFGEEPDDPLIEPLSMQLIKDKMAKKIIQGRNKESRHYRKNNMMKLILMIPIPLKLAMQEECDKTGISMVRFVIKAMAKHVGYKGRLW